MSRVKYLIFGLILGIAFLSYNLVFAQTSSKEATVILVKGDVKIQRAGKVEWLDAKEGMRLSDGDTAKTGKESAVEMSFDKDNKNVVHLAENTTAILRGRQLRQIELPQGRIRFLIKKLRRDSSFEIRTPTAVAGARGSGGEVEAELERTVVKAFEDELFVQSFDEQGNLIKEIILTEGWQTDIEKFQAPSELTEVTDRDTQDWDSWRGDLNERIDIERKKEGGEKGGEQATGDTVEQVSNVEKMGEPTQEKGDYKEQTVDAQDSGKIDDRAGSGETAGGRGESTGSGSGGSGGGGYQCP